MRMPCRSAGALVIRRGALARSCVIEASARRSRATLSTDAFVSDDDAGRSWRRRALARATALASGRRLVARDGRKRRRHDLLGLQFR